MVRIQCKSACFCCWWCLRECYHGTFLHIIRYRDLAPGITQPQWGSNLNLAGGLRLYQGSNSPWLYPSLNWPTGVIMNTVHNHAHVPPMFFVKCQFWLVKLQINPNVYGLNHQCGCKTYPLWPPFTVLRGLRRGWTPSRQVDHLVPQRALWQSVLPNEQGNAPTPGPCCLEGQVSFDQNIIWRNTHTYVYIYRHIFCILYIYSIIVLYIYILYIYYIIYILYFIYIYII
jgi:hypothetical protein